MSGGENSGPGGSSKKTVDPKKTASPSPSPTSSYFNLDDYIRSGIEITPAYTAPTPTGMYGVGSSVSEINTYRTGERGATQTGYFTFSMTQDGINASDSRQPENPLPIVAMLADYGNRANYLLSPNQNLYSAVDAASFWLGKNMNRERRNWAFETLVSKNYITGDSAKVDRNSVEADRILAAALTAAVTSISIKNYNRQGAGFDMLTLDEGLFQLDVAPSSQTDSNGAAFGGTSTRITRQEFKPEDYRMAVDKAYKDITGQGASESTLDTYIKVLQKLEAKDPAKQVAKTTGTAQNNTTVVKETGGVSQAAAEDLLLKQAIAEPETEYYQKATTFMDYFNEAIKAKVDL